MKNYMISLPNWSLLQPRTCSFALRSIAHSILDAIGYTPEKEDKANRLLPMDLQLQWFRETGYVEVDCYWKWLEMALLAGYKA